MSSDISATIGGKFPGYQALPDPEQELVSDQPTREEQLEKLKLQAIALLKAANENVGDDAASADRQPASTAND